MKLKTLKTKSTVTLEGNLNGTMVEELQKLLLEAVKENKPITIKASDVSHIDTLCCQLLISAAMSCKEKKVSFKVESPSQNMQNSLNTLGLNTLLDEGYAA